MKANHRNVTLSLPEPLLRRFRVYAAKRNQSMTAVMAGAIEKVLEEEGKDSEYQRAMRRMIRRMENARDLGTGGKIAWKREELYDRDGG